MVTHTEEQDQEATSQEDVYISVMLPSMDFHLWLILSRRGGGDFIFKKWRTVGTLYCGAIDQPPLGVLAETWRPY